MLLLSLWDKGLSWEGPGEGKSHFLSLPSSCCLVSSVYRASDTLPERLHHLAACGARGTGGLVQPLLPPHTPTLRHWYYSDYPPSLRVIFSLTPSPLGVLPAHGLCPLPAL